MQLEVEDLVFYPNNTLFNAARNFSSKLRPRYKGPVTVLEKKSAMQTAKDWKIPCEGTKNYQENPKIERRCRSVAGFNIKDAIY